MTASPVPPPESPASAKHVTVMDPLIAVVVHFTVDTESSGGSMRRQHRVVTDASEVDGAIAPALAWIRDQYGESVWVTKVDAERLR